MWYGNIFLIKNTFCDKDFHAYKFHISYYGALEKNQQSVCVFVTIHEPMVHYYLSIYVRKKSFHCDCKLFSHSSFLKHTKNIGSDYIRGAFSFDIRASTLVAAEQNNYKLNIL